MKEGMHQLNIFDWLIDFDGWMEECPNEWQTWLNEWMDKGTSKISAWFYQLLTLDTFIRTTHFQVRAIALKEQ